MRLEDCPARAAVDVIGGKWKPVILYHVMTAKRRFGELRRLLPDATQKMLTQQLRELERDGIIARRVYPEVPPRVEYSLTPYGKTLRPVMRELCKWGQTRRELAKAV
jgi:DNA-binding HxlR family transcriptional regulator